MPRFLISLLGAFVGLSGSWQSVAASLVAITPEEAIETTRFFADHEGEQICLSPDGSRYAVATITGDVARDGNWFTVMFGSLDSIDAARPTVIARMFGRSLGDEKNAFKSFLTIYGDLTWIDNDKVGFYWEDQDGNIQYFVANVITGGVDQLTHHPTSLHGSALGIGPDGALAYAAKADSQTSEEVEFARMEYNGFVAEQDDVLALIQGIPDKRGSLDRLFGHKYFYQSGPDSEPAEIVIGGRETTPQIPGTVTISPDGSVAILDDHPIAMSPAWTGYTSEFYAGFVEDALAGMTSKYEVRAIKQLFVVDLSDLSVRPLWNALTQAYPPKTAWSPDGKWIVVGPTFLPPDTQDEHGLAGSAIAAVEVATGRYQRIPYDGPNARDIVGLEWTSDSRIVVHMPHGDFTYRKSNDEWWTAAKHTSTSFPIDVYVKSDINSPPVLMAADSETGEESVLFDPNPELASRFRLGHVENLSWEAEDGRTWKGQLYYPANYSPGTTYPFVLQTHGGADDRFSLYGYPEELGLGTGSGVFLAQLLAGRGIGVLQVSDATSGVPQGENARIYMNGYESAVDLLIEKGIADPERIAIQGFSRTGWLVQHALVHSDFVFAAAIAADNVEAGYVENTLAQPGSMEAENGGDPTVAEGLEAWLENAAQFNASRIMTPLLKISQGPGDIQQSYRAWEIVARLRRLNRPVELYFMPDQEAHGGHQPQNPRQIAAIQNRALDWWLFWLAGEEDPSPDKVAQYHGWRKLRAQQQNALSQRRPPLLDWRWEPIPGTAKPPILNDLVAPPNNKSKGPSS